MKEGKRKNQVRKKKNAKIKKDNSDSKPTQIKRMENEDSKNFDKNSTQSYTNDEKAEIKEKQDEKEKIIYDYDYLGKSIEDDTGHYSDYMADSSTGDRNAGPKYSSFSTIASASVAIRNCRRYPLQVDFEEMGWSGWIIHPRSYNAYHCKGKCSFPLSQHLNPSNHATVQSIMYTMGLGDQPVEMPCCAPNELYDINLLYFDENDDVVLRRYEEMVVASCACR